MMSSCSACIIAGRTRSANFAVSLMKSLLRKARRAAGNNLARILYGDVPEPVGAVTIYGWEGEGDLRIFDGTRREVEISGIDADGSAPVVSVDIDGIQYPDGHVDRRIRVDGLSCDDLLTLEQAQRLGQALILGATEAHEMKGNDKVVA
jgi:hypothetical protein